MLQSIRRQLGRFFTIAVLFTGAAVVSAQTREAKFSDWPEHTRISGRVIVSNGLSNLAGLDRFSSRIFESKTVVVIEGDRRKSPWRPKLEDAVGDGKIFYLPDSGILWNVVARLQPGYRGKFSVDERKLATEVDEYQHDGIEIRNADVVIVEDGAVKDLKILKPFLQSLLAKSGTVILEGRPGTVAGQYSMTAAGLDLLSFGLELVPDTMITFKDADANRSTNVEDRASTLAAADGTLVALILDHETAFMLSGRKITCFGGWQCDRLGAEV